MRARIGVKVRKMRFKVALFIMLFSLSLFAREKPNVIFVLCDDLGYGDVGFAWQVKRPTGAVRIATPNLDRLAAEGTILTDHYCASPVCAPSRASIMTGKLQLGSEKAGSEGCSLVDNNFDFPISETRTLGTVMKAAGYETYAIGKWGIGGGGESGKERTAHPLARGFDHYYGFLDHLAGHTYYHYDGISGGKVYMGVYESGKRSREFASAAYDTREKANGGEETLKAYWNATKTAEGRYSTDVFIARTKKYIEEQLADSERRRNPFFMYLAINTVHGSGRNDSTLRNTHSLHVPGGAYVRSDNVDGSVKWPLDEEPLEKRNTWIDPRYQGKGLCENAQRYATAITRMDDALGDLVDFLKRKGIYKNTIIIFTSDNGPAAEYGADPRFFDSYGPFDGMKRDIYEGGMRMPTFVCWPGHKHKPTESAPSISADWLGALEKLTKARKQELPIPVSKRIEANYRHGGGGSQYANEFHARKGAENCGGVQWMMRKGDIVSLVAGNIPRENPRKYNVVKDPHQDYPLKERK